jgi:hypothetical protein
MPSYVHLQRNSLNIQVVDYFRKNVPKMKKFMPNIFSVEFMIFCKSCGFLD